MTHVEIKRRIVGTRRDDLVTVPAGDLHDVIVLYEATAERESKLREAAESFLAAHEGGNVHRDEEAIAREFYAALETEGGES